MIDTEKHFHTIGVREGLSSLKTSRTGLSSDEVEKRLGTSVTEVVLLEITKYWFLRKRS